MTTSDGSLRLRILRVTWRQDRLVVRSGLPTLVAALSLAAIPALSVWAMSVQGRWSLESAPVLALSAAVTLLLWTMGGPWRLTLDRRSGRVTLWRGPWRTSWPLADVVAVRVVSMRQAQIERVRRERRLMPYAPYPDILCGVALVDGSGRWRQVTRANDRVYGYPTPRLDEAEQVARRIAEFLGAPLLPRYETPPGGAVPQRLER